MRASAQAGTSLKKHWMHGLRSLPAQGCARSEPFLHRIIVDRDAFDFEVAPVLHDISRALECGAGQFAGFCEEPVQTPAARNIFARLKQSVRQTAPRMVGVAIAHIQMAVGFQQRISDRLPITITRQCDHRSITGTLNEAVRPRMSLGPSVHLPWRIGFGSDRADCGQC